MRSSLGLGEVGEEYLAVLQTPQTDTSSGLRPDAGDFLLFGQEKSHQREGRPGVARYDAYPVLPA